MSQRSYAILGTGALGGYYGARLLHAGCTVRFLLRGDYTHVQAQGMRVESMHGTQVLPQVEAYRDASEMPPSDVAVVAMKTTQNDALASMLPHAVKPDGAVLVLQNGLEPERHAAGLVGAERVIGGLCFLCSNRVGPGHFVQTRFDHIRLGEYAQRGITPRLNEIAADFCAGDVQTEAVDDLPLTRWKKLVWNIPYNGLSAVLDADTHELMHNADTEALVTELMQETARAARATGGHDIDDAFIETMLGNTRKMGPYLPSMQIDRRLGRAMEVEAIFGDPVRRAASNGCPVPLIQTLYRQLRLLDARRLPSAVPTST
ncbi:MAG: putative 2-dehydropantoate 2-reductase [Phycisphaerales bacterium JB063]